MEKPQPKHPVLVWALTIQGEVTAHYCADRAEAEKIGTANVASRAWRTWDAFEVPEGAKLAEGRKLVSSHDKSKKPRRPRILADWTPPDPPPSSPHPTVSAESESAKGRKVASSHDKPKKTRRQRIIPD